MSHRFQLGARVRFSDANATVSDGEAASRSGTVNGTIFVEPDTGDEFVPLWCERDNGREPTTVFVALSNVLDDAA